MECKVYRFTGLENNDSIIDKKNHALSGRKCHPLAHLLNHLLVQLLIYVVVYVFIRVFRQPSRASPGGGNHVDHRIHTA